MAAGQKGGKYHGRGASEDGLYVQTVLVAALWTSLSIAIFRCKKEAIVLNALR